MRSERRIGRARSVPDRFRAPPTSFPLDPKRKRKQCPGIHTGPNSHHEIQIGRLPRTAGRYMRFGFVDRRYVRHLHILRTL